MSAICAVLCVELALCLGGLFRIGRVIDGMVDALQISSKSAPAMAPSWSSASDRSDCAFWTSDPERREWPRH